MSLKIAAVNRAALPKNANVYLVKKFLYISVLIREIRGVFSQVMALKGNAGRYSLSIVGISFV